MNWLKIVALTSPLIVLIAAASWPYIAFRKRRQAALQLKGPKLNSYLLGNVRSFPKDRTKLFDLILSFVKQYQEEGVYRILFGPIPSVSIIDPYLLAEIMGSSKHTVKGFLYDFVLPWLGTGLLTSSGAKWKARRRLTTPAFHFEVLKRYLIVMNDQTDIMINKIETNLGQEIDFFEYITTCALDIICETAMGKKVNAQQSNDKKLSYVEDIYKMSKIILDRGWNPLLRSDLIFNLTSLGREHNKTVHRLHQFTLGVIRERREFLKNNKLSEDQRKAFLDILLTSEVDGQPLSDEDIREEVDTFMFEGHDTTSASLAWTIYAIGRYPEIQDRLREEVNNVMGESKEVTMEMISQFKYMEMVMKESLRMYPSVPSIGRILTEDIEIRGVKILKGTNININILGVHYNSKYWDDPFTFNPERWNSDLEKVHPYLYIPFSAGQRNCIGQQFAKNEEKVVLAKMIKNFKILSLDEKPLMLPELILRPANGIKIKVEKI